MKSKPRCVGKQKYCVFSAPTPSDLLRKVAKYLEKEDINLEGLSPLPIALYWKDWDGWITSIPVDYWFDEGEDHES